MCGYVDLWSCSRVLVNQHARSVDFLIDRYNIEREFPESDANNGANK